MGTDLGREREEQGRWRLRPGFADFPTFDRLVDNEFLSADEQTALQSKALARVLDFASTAVPYYQDLFAARRLRPEDIRGPGDLHKLPLLDKGLVREHENRLRARALPRGQKLDGQVSSSGTTGQPTRVLQTRSNNLMYTFLDQRRFRWFRFDPSKTLAFIRSAVDLPRQPNGKTLEDGVTCHRPGWRYAGHFFETGPWFGLTMTTPVERQIEWLQEIRPAYLGSHSSWLEHLSYVTGGRTQIDSLEGVFGVVEQMTAPTRQRIERVFATPVHQGYGLNEIGRVAVRCAAGRYHVHSEHCLVEIVDGDGQPCPPGRPGRIAVTALRNAAMPLIRYDTDDQAEAAAGPCPCGRTLPAFVNLLGRYRRHASLPEGSYALFLALKRTVTEMPDDLARNMRQFQVHQYRDRGMELRLATVGPLPAAFHERVQAVWQEKIGDRPDTLVIVEVDDIPRLPNGKFQDFTSDYMPDPTSGSP
jgi:phenylacetate-CoA ligase